MRNQPHSHWQLIDSTADRREEIWNLDRQAELRTWFILLITFVVVCAISVRLYALKQLHAESFLANANPVTLQSERVPAMDGRIYSSDGQLLAYDHQRFGIAVHYRWLQSPPDERWWRQQARSRLKRSQWSNKAAMETARQAVLDEQAQLWTRISAISGIPEDQVQQKRSDIQKRIERIAESVQRRQQEREQQQEDQKTRPAKIEGNRWQKFWQLVVQELTQPPIRESRDPIIIKEELDYHEIVSDISTRLVAEIEARPSQYPGVRIVTRTQRIYPLGDFASHVIGNRTSIREEKLLERQQQLTQGDPLSYQAGDRLGRFGVERSYDVTLRGLPGARQLTRNRRGEVIRIQPERESRSGQHLVLSLNSQLQKTAEQLLDQRINPEPSLIPPLPQGMPMPESQPPVGGSLLVMNLYSGELLAAACAPRPDLTRMTQGDSDYWKQLTTDSRSPLLSRLTQVTLAPGSTFKPLTAIAFCETTRSTSHPFLCQGFLDTPESHRCAIFRSSGVGHGEIDLVSALARSCNVFFFAAARQMKPEPLVKWSREFRFGFPTGVDLPFEQSGHVPAPADNSPDSSYQWYPGDNLGLSIGQSYLSVTPLQMLVMTAAIANGGELVTPTVVSRVLTDDTSPSLLPSVQPQERTPGKRLDISPATLTVVRQGMQQTVTHPQGTAFSTVRSGKISIAGKTGTAQIGLNRPNHAWFIGYAPAESPQVAFVVCLEQGGAGGEQAGPLAKAIVEKMLELELIFSR